MSINNSDLNDCEIDYEEFEDILEYDKVAVASTDALLSSFKSNEISEESLQRDLEQVEKLRVEEVRWFYRSSSKKKWKPFIGSDSISIELEWRSVSRSDNDIKRVCVRGGMYEVDVLERRCFPVYWSSFNLKGVEDSFEVTRGTWFYDGSFSPLEEDVADRIEVEHIERWKGVSVEEVKKLIGHSVMHSVKLANCHVDWYSINDVYLHSDAVSYRALRNIVQKFGASKTSTSGSKLHRGYCEDAMYEDCMPDVEHLVFVVHGIGAKPDRHKIVRNTNSFRMACNRVAAKHFAHYTGRVEFLPVEWRSKLKLDDGIVDSITPKKGQGMRQFLNNNLMDIMYYTSPIYRAEIVDGLKKEIGRLHDMFVQRNPNFCGKISVFAHSLGSVIMHDIMTGWSPELLFQEYLQKQYAERDKLAEKGSSVDVDMKELQIAKAKVAQMEAQDHVKQESSKGLGFYVHNFFCVGSPLAIFLSLRGQRPGYGQGTQEDIIPKNVCNRIFNIFHPSDPIAYRLEPMLLSHYSSVAPLQIHWHNALNKTPYHEMPPKPYQNEVLKEMSTISAQETSVEPDCLSVEISDGEDSMRTEENEEKKLDKNMNESDKTSEVAANSSTELTRRASYLRAISGGAFKVGKALWSRARGSSPTRSDKASVASPDSSLASENELGEMNFESPLNEKVGSRTSSRSGSPAPRSPRSPRQTPFNNLDNSAKVKFVEEEQPIDFSAVGSVNLEHRMDFELQEGFTESRLGYASITSHTSYWGNQDVAFFVLMHIHPPASLVQSYL